MPQKPVTEQQILEAMEEHSEAWVEQLVRRAKNQRLVLSDKTICEVGDHLQMPELMDQVVTVRVEDKGPYTLAELNPPMGTPSVCEVVTPTMVRRLLAATGGRLSAEDAYRLCDYHLTDADDALLEQIVRMSDLSRWDSEAILDDLGYTGDIEALLSHGNGRRGAAKQSNQNEQHQNQGRHTARAIIGFFSAVLLVLAFMLGGVLAGGVILAVALVLAVGTPDDRSSKDKYPDLRSDYNRRVWADDHNYEADGDSDHNWDADGDRPW